MSKTLNATSPSFSINSRYRDNDTDPINDFQYTINIDNSKNYNCCALTSCRIPKSWYVVEPLHGNNIFNLREGIVNTLITIPRGNYNINSFKTILENLLNQYSPNSWIYQISYPDSFTQSQTFLYTFTVFKNSSQPSLVFSDSSRITEICGFDDNSTNTFVGNVLTSLYTVQFELTNFIVIKSNICNNLGNRDSDTTVLAQIDVSHVRDGDIINYQMITLDDASRIITTINQNVYSFSIYDDQDRPLQLFDDWNLTLLLFEHDNSSSLQINDLKLKYIPPPLPEPSEPEPVSIPTQEDYEKQLLLSEKTDKK